MKIGHIYNPFASVVLSLSWSHTGQTSIMFAALTVTSTQFWRVQICWDQSWCFQILMCPGFMKNKKNSRKRSWKRVCPSDLPFCCGVGLPLAQHRQGAASWHHFLFDLPRDQVARFHRQEVDAWLEPHPAETREKREGEVNLEFRRAHEKQEERSQIVTGGVRGTLPGIEFASLRISLPRFSGWFSLIPDSATLPLCKISFKIDSLSVALPPAEYFGGTRQKADSGGSHESSHFHQEKCCVTDSRAGSRWVGDRFKITNDGFGNWRGGGEWTMFTLPTPSHLLLTENKNHHFPNCLFL